MNNSAKSLRRVIALLLLVATALTMVSCDSLQSIIGGSHTHSFVDGKCECGATIPTHEHVYVDGKCECGAKDNNNNPTHEHNFVNGKCECGESDPNFNGNNNTEYQTITIAQALEIAAANPDGTTELYYINATVKSIKSASYGEMYIEDETGEIYVYGTRGADGETYFDKLSERPVKGDKVLLLCQLSQYDGKSQVKVARLISFEHVEVNIEDLTAYEEMTIAAAREAETGKLVRVSGVVAQITYANGKVPSGVILVDGTSSIYVYSNDLAGQVTVGNTVEIAAEKTYYVLSSEQSNADKFGYKGSNQLDNVIVISNDKATTDFDKSWITEATVKEIMDTPVTEDITTKIFKVNALVKKAPGNGFTNYYIDDIDGVTGSYVYTQCNGGDFGWLDQFDGKICTVYLVALNAKASTSGCVWRFIPVAVSDDGYTFDTTKAAEYAVKYHGIGQFINKYTGDPALEMIGSVSSELLNFEGATLSYSSSDDSIISFTTADGKTVMHCNKSGTATVTVTGSYNGATYSETVEIVVEIIEEEIDSISIADAIAKEVGEEVIIRGIVGPSLVNKSGFYLFDESGMVAVTVAESLFAEIAIGNEVVIKGIRDMWHGEGATYGQICVTNATIEANFYGNHDYLTIDTINTTVEEFYNFDEQDMSLTTKLYLLKATVLVEETAYYTNIYLTNADGTVKLRLYCSSANQYNWLKAYAGQEVSVEIAPCNWNSKNYYTGCVLAVVNEDGTKVLNTLNWN